MFAQEPHQSEPIQTSDQSSVTPVVAPKLTKAELEAFEIKIYNQVGLVYQGRVKAIASANNQGEFSVLPGHTNFISLITQPVIIYPPDGQPPKKFEVGLGVIRCLYNQVQIYTGLLVDKETEAMAAALHVNATPRGGFDSQLKTAADDKPQTGLRHLFRQRLRR